MLHLLQGEKPRITVLLSYAAPYFKMSLMWMSKQIRSRTESVSSMPCRVSVSPVAHGMC